MQQIAKDLKDALLQVFLLFQRTAASATEPATGHSAKRILLFAYLLSFGAVSLFSAATVKMMTRMTAKMPSIPIPMIGSVCKNSSMSMLIPP